MNQYILAMGGIASMVLLLSFTRRSPSVGFALILLTRYIEFLTNSQLLIFQLGQISIYMADLLALLLLTVFLLNIGSAKALMTHPLGKAFRWFVGIAAFTVVVSAFRFRLGGVRGAHNLLYFTVTVLYLVTFPLRKQDLIAMFKVFILYNILTLLLIPLRYFGLIAGTWHMIAYSGDNYLARRYLVNYQCLHLVIMAAALFIVRMSAHIRYGAAALVLALVGIIAVVLIPQRMVWIVALLIIVYLTWSYRSHLGQGSVGLLLIVVGALAMTILVGNILGLDLQILPKDSYVFQAGYDIIGNYESSNAAGRIDSWINIIRQLSLSDILVGRGYGATIERESLGRVVSWGVHNYILQTLTHGGIFLLTAVIVFWGHLIVKLPKANILGVPDYYVQIVWLAAVSTVLFSLTSVPGYFLGLPAGIATSLLVQTDHS